MVAGVKAVGKTAILECAIHANNITDKVCNPFNYYGSLPSGVMRYSTIY